MAQVVVAGSINMDVVVRSPRHPRPGETVTGAELCLHPGGKGANQAVAAARAGVPARLIGRVGDDDFGARVLEAVAGHGVDVGAVGQVPGVPTGAAVIVVDEAGENTIVTVPGANATVAAADADTVPLDATDVAVTQLEIPLRTVEAFLTRAEDAGALTVLNAAPAKPCPLELLALARVLVVNEWELALLTDTEPPSADRPPTVEATLELARQLRARPEQTVVVTLGPLGAVATFPDGSAHEPGRTVRAVDATGAGDCFVGALAARLASGDGFEAALRFANAAASLCVQRMGAVASMPAATEVQAALAGRRPPERGLRAHL